MRSQIKEFRLPALISEQPEMFCFNFQFYVYLEPVFLISLDSGFGVPAFIRSDG
jgi:hypothetical protein